MEDTSYREECSVDVQHVCEQHVPVPVEVPYPVYKYKSEAKPLIGPQLPPDKHDDEEQQSLPSQPLYYSQLHTPDNSDAYLPPPAPADSYLPPPPPPAPTPAPHHQPIFSPGVDASPLMTQYQYDPTPGPHHAVSSIAPLTHHQDHLTHHHIPSHLQPFLRTPRTLSPLALALFERLNSTRSKRSVMFPEMSDESDPSEEQLRSLVSQVLEQVIQENQRLSNVKATIRGSRSIAPVSFNLNTPQDHIDHYHNHHHPPNHPPHPPPHEPQYHDDPVITTHELPAPEGCRSYATKKCYKIPVVVPRKVPYEVCDVVPDVECFQVLKKVPELQVRYQPIMISLV